MFNFQAFASSNFATINVTSVYTCPLDQRTFVVVYSDDTNDDISFQIWDTNGTQVLGEVDVDTSAGGISGTSMAVGVSAFNDTVFVIGWWDPIDQDATFAIYNRTGNLLVGPIDVDTDVGVAQTCQVSCFNSTHFVIGWFDRTDRDVTFAIYDSSGNLLVGPIDADENAGLAFSSSVSAFNSTHFVIGWFDDDATEVDATFSIYDSAGNLIVGPIDADTDVGLGCNCVHVSTLNTTHFVISWFDQADYHITFSVYRSNTKVTGPIDVDADAGNSQSVRVVALNSTVFAISWYDKIDFDLSFATYWTNGTAIASPTDIESWPTAHNSPFFYHSPCSQETATNIKIYGDNWIIAYANTTSQAVWQAFKPDGTTWDGSITPSPTFGNVAYSTTQAGASCQFTITWNSLSVNVSGYIFSTNNTGTWVNDTWTSSWYEWLNTTSAKANVTKTLNAAIGVTISFKWYCNDTNNVWGYTPIYSFVTTSIGNWYNVESWNITINSQGLWNYVENWTLNINAPGAWHTVESWQVLIIRSLAYHNVESWQISIHTLWNVTTQISPTHDSYTSKGYNETNYGTEPTMRISTIIGNVDMGYAWIKLSLSSLPEDADIYLARLYLYVNASVENPAIECRFCSDDTWTETTITWNNQPSYGTLLDFKNITTPWSGWIYLDVTAQAITEFEGDKAISLMLRTNVSLIVSAAEFFTKEYAGNRPYLLVGYTSSTGLPVHNVESWIIYLIAQAITEIAITWWLPMTFILGMCGLVMMFTGPLIAIHKAKNHEYYEAIRLGVTITAIGFALVVAWLW